MNILRWIFENIAIPLSCSLYASIIVVRYIEFSQMCAEARDIHERTGTNFFMFSYLGKADFEKEVHKEPGKPAPLFHFAALALVASRLKSRGHKRAAQQISILEGKMLTELNRRLDQGKYTEKDWEKYFFEEMPTKEPFPDLRPSWASLLSILKWNV